MITPGKLDLVAQRWTPFVYDIAFPGYDFTDALYALQVRLRPDAPGVPIISLNPTVAPAEGISYAVVTVGGVPTTTFQIRIAEATIEAVLLNAGKPGADVVLAWDMHITGGGLPKTRWLEGSFTIRPGVTQ